MSTRSEWEISIDVGGTFSDLVAVERLTQRYTTIKVPSRPADPSLAISESVKEFLTRTGVSPDDVRSVFHGTTVATNTLVQLSGVRAGLLITRGMGAVYIAGQSKRATTMETLDLYFQKPPMLVPARMTEEVEERMSYDGEIITPLNEESAREAIRRLGKKGVKSIAVCLLFSFMNATHERRLREMIYEEIPGCRVSLSSEVLPVIREYQRLSTTVVDAYVGPIMESYLNLVRKRVIEQGVKTRSFFLMQSSGGIMQIDVAGKYPVQTLLSGPAAGAIAGAYLSKTAGIDDNVVSYDMGGTSTDVCLIRKGVLSLTTGGSMGGQTVGVPMIDVRTIGAGGGTIAWLTSDGQLKVGPRSAGADPGPACYDQGGKEPTITDVDLLLGYLDGDRFLGGKKHLKVSLSEQAVARRIARPLGMDVMTACQGIKKIVESAMTVEVRLCIMEKGFDPTTFNMVTFGGAGPVHGPQMMKDLGISTIMVPLYPGLTSSMGLLMTDIQHHYMQSYLRPLTSVSAEALNEIYSTLEHRAREDAQLEGLNIEEVQLIRQMDLRYVGQGYQLTIAAPGKALCEEDKAKIRRDFDDTHLNTYFHNAPDIPVEVVNLRLIAVKAMPKFPLKEQTLGSKSPDATAQLGHRRVFFDKTGWVEKTPIFDRAYLVSGNQIDGPAIIAQVDSTTVLCPGQVGNIDKFGNIIIRLTEVSK